MSVNVLDWAKAQLHGIESLNLIKNNDQAQRLLVAWTFYKPGMMRRAFWQVDEKKADPTTELERAWDKVGPIDYALLGKMADIPLTRVAPLFERLRMVHLIWPDGTIADAARRALVGEAEGYIRGLIAKGKKI